MKAAILIKEKKIEIQDVDIPSIKNNEVLLKVYYAGICSTDIKFYNGEIPCNYPIILGHEFSGKAVEIGSETEGIIKGNYYNVQPNISCGYCNECRKKRFCLCKNKICYGTHINGGLSEYCAIDYKLLYSISENQIFESTFIEPIACCLHALDRCNIKTGDDVLIIGGGFTGLIFTQLVQLQGARVHVITRSSRKRALAESLGVDSVYKSICEININFDVVIDAVGKPEIVDTAFQVVGRGGKILLFGVNPIGIGVFVNPYTIWEKELSIVGSRGNGHNHFDAIRILSKLHINDLISHVIELECVGKISNLVEEEDFVKAAVSFVKNDKNQHRKGRNE